MPVMPSVPLIVFRECPPSVINSLSIVQTMLPLTFGRYSVTLLFLELTHPPILPEIAVFVLVFVHIKRFRLKYRGMNEPKILDRINRDAEIYFVLTSVINLLAVVMFFTVKVGSSAPASEFTCADGWVRFLSRLFVA